MSKLIEMANQIKTKRQEEEKKRKDAILATQAKDLEFILKEFEEAFKELLPLLAEDGISCSAHFNTEYTYEGSYILFTKGDQELKMDFLNREKYRYEHTPYGSGTGRAVYGQWPLEGFILFIDEWLNSPCLSEEGAPDLGADCCQPSASNCHTENCRRHHL